MTLQCNYHKRADLLAWQVVEVAPPPVAPDDDLVSGDELSTHPSFSDATRLRTQDGKVASIVNLFALKINYKFTFALQVNYKL